MLNLTTPTKIYIYTPVADMRKGIDGLSGIVRSEFGEDPTDGSLYVFINRRRDRMKILHFDGGGFCRPKRGQNCFSLDHALNL